MIRCLNCQAENLDDAAYCANCGFTLAWEGPDPPPPSRDRGPAPEQDEPETIAGDDATHTVRRPAPPPQSRRPSPRVVAIVIACVGLTLAVILAVVVTGRGGSPSESASRTPAIGAPASSATQTSTSPSGVAATDRGEPFDPVHVRTAPGVDAPRTGDDLHKGDHVTLLCSHDGWDKIGDHRWVWAKQFAETVPECEPGDVDNP